MNTEEIRLLLEKLESCPVYFDPEQPPGAGPRRKTALVPADLFNEVKRLMARFLRVA